MARGSGPITIVDTSTNLSAGTVLGSSTPNALEFVPDGTRAYSATSTGVQIIDTSAPPTVTNSIPFTVATDGLPAAIAIKP